MDIEQNDEELDEELLDESLVTTPGEQSEPRLGEDPFTGLDIGWLTRDQGELSIEVLGSDPLEGVELEWLEQEPAVPSGQEQAQLADQELQPAEVEPPVIPAYADVSPLAAAGIDVERVFAAPEPAKPPLPPPASLAAAPSPPPPQPQAIATPDATFYFPADFKWGVAVSAHQVEGDNRGNDWWAWEEGAGHIKNGHRSGAACNWWQNAEADFDRAAAVGINALRLSVEWSRIEPRQGTFDEAALERYAQMLQALRAKQIEPLVTLHHFTNPQWLAQMGGWENPEAVALFARFVRRTVETLGRHCDMWCTVNEPNLYGYLGYVEGRFPPGRSDLKAAGHVIRHMLAGHAAAYREIHAVQPQARVGLALHLRVFDAADPASSADRRAAAFADRAFNQSILDALFKGRWTVPLGIGFARKLRHTLDWIGLNYYARDLVAFDQTQRAMGSARRTTRDGAEMLDGDYGEFYPQGMLRCLQRLGHLGHLSLPIYITENGIPDDNDDQRPRYILTHLHQVWRALQLSYPVKGYYHWTLVDNFEWSEGWTARFGLFELDPRTQVRTPRHSARLYSTLLRANAITPELIDTYSPEVRPQLLPGQAIRP